MIDPRFWPPGAVIAAIIAVSYVLGFWRGYQLHRKPKEPLIQEPNYRCDTCDTLFQPADRVFRVRGVIVHATEHCVWELVKQRGWTLRHLVSERYDGNPDR